MTEKPVGPYSADILDHLCYGNYGRNRKNGRDERAVGGRGQLGMSGAAGMPLLAELKQGVSRTGVTITMSLRMELRIG
jgi:hypothetical protein